jgi:hypothetical protein
MPQVRTPPGAGGKSRCCRWTLETPTLPAPSSCSADGADHARPAASCCRPEPPQDLAMSYSSVFVTTLLAACVEVTRWGEGGEVAAHAGLVGDHLGVLASVLPSPREPSLARLTRGRARRRPAGGAPTAPPAAARCSHAPGRPPSGATCQRRPNPCLATLPPCCPPLGPCPWTTPPAAPYTATCSQLPISGQGVPESQAAMHLLPPTAAGP